MSESGVDGDDETVWRILAESRRRHLLEHLAETTGPTTTAEVARVIAPDCDGDPEQIRLALRHVDVPKLVETAVVGYDRERDRIEPTPRVDQLCAVVDAVEEALESPSRAR